MEGVTNLPMRIWFHLVSAPETLATPFLRVTATYPHKELPREFAPELGELRAYLPYQLVPQLMAADTDEFLRVAPALLRESEFVELNCGCPSPTCVGKGAGSSLLKNADEFGTMIGRISRELGPGRFAVKMRTGFQSEQEFSTLIAPLSALPLARLTVHGRTRPNRYTGMARWDLIEEAAQKVVAPLVASGDVVDDSSLQQRLRVAPSVQHVIIGRGALRNPWIFEALRRRSHVSISFQHLRLAVLVLALLQELMATDPVKLFTLCKEGLFNQSCEHNVDRWLQVYRALAVAVWPAGHDHPDRPSEVSRATLGRVKLVWNYLRSSLPAPFFAPPPLRSGSLEGFLDGLTAAYDVLERPQYLQLCHRPEFDWLYSGEKKVKVVESTCKDLADTPI